ncbi:MAG: hypothetical protein JW920_08370 [Deltaproteobacteria bacterium]|nr:hypothetical protein [Deltaproteobacteria bacterium]
MLCFSRDFEIQLPLSKVRVIVEDWDAERAGVFKSRVQNETRRFNV